MAILSDSEGRRFEWQLVAISAACVLFAVLAATLFRVAAGRWSRHESPPI